LSQSSAHVVSGIEPGIPGEADFDTGLRQDGKVGNSDGSAGAVSADSADGFSAPTYHHAAAAAVPSGPAIPSLPDPPTMDAATAGAPVTARRRISSARPAGTGDVTVTRAVVARSRYFSRLVAHKVISASEADGARESGLTALIWNQVMSYGSDAMVTVALAGTVFFSAPSAHQRGNVLLYLAMTIAPFAVIAPVIGPALDRFQHGRRWVIAATAIGRAALAVIMALNFTDLYVLFPAALGSLVLSKAYSVIRSAAAPRLVPSGMTLVEANARLSLFGLGAAIFGGALVGAAIRTTGSYPLGLFITAGAFATTAFYALRLPRIVDALPPPVRRADAQEGPTPAQPWPIHPETARLPRRGPARILRWLLTWASRGFDLPVVGALQGASALRWLSGFLTMFVAFYVESTSHGWRAVVSLGALGLATGVGNFLGTGVGTRLRLMRAELIVLAGTGVVAVGCLGAALFFSLGFALVVALLAATANSLSKLALDAVIQRDVVESLRSSAFGRSETFLQLAWVLGATVALLLPSRDGTLGFTIAATVTALVALYALVRTRLAAIKSPTTKS
jgi:MFS family permease